MEAFLQILTTQMANQNPLEPMKDSEYFGQIAQMGTVQGMDALRSSQENVQATSLLGKQVVASRPAQDGATSFDPVVGTVTYVTNKEGKTYVGVKEENGNFAEITLDKITTVTSN